MIASPEPVSHRVPSVSNAHQLRHPFSTYEKLVEKRARDVVTTQQNGFRGDDIKHAIHKTSCIKWYDFHFHNLPTACPLIALARSDRRTRTKALSTLRTFLSGRSTASALTPLDHLKLWKGLFFALWMSDRPIPQQNLCEELAGLLCVLPDEAVIPWLEGYWGVMSKEWTNIDVLRMEKFLLLTRRVFGASLAWVTGGGEKLRRSRERAMLDLFEKWPMDGSGHLSRVPVGLRLHVLDIWVDEAEKAGMLDEKSTSCDLDFAEGIRKIVQSHLKSPSKPVRARAKESLADRRLAWNQRQSCLEAEDDGLKDGGAVDGWAGFKD